MAGLTLTAADAIMKELYDGQVVEDMAYKDHPFLGMVPKKEDFYGDLYPIPIKYGRPQGRSATFSTGRTNKQPSQFKRFNLTHVKNYGFADIDRIALEAAEVDKGAFIRTAQTEVDGTIDNLAQALAIDLFGSGSGSRGQVGSESTTTVTLKDINDVVNFEVNQEIVAAAAEVSGSLRDSGNAATITAINRTTGVLTTDSNWTTQISGLAADDFLYVEGDRNLVVTGLRGWLPATAPSSGESFFGVDRTADVDRLAGVRYDGSSDALGEVFTNAAARLVRNGGKPDCCFVDPITFADLENDLGAKVRYNKVLAMNAKGPIAHIGFTGIEVAAQSGGTITIFSDKNCPNAYAFMLTKEDWKLCTLKGAPRIFDQGDGLTWLRNRTEDSLELTAGYYGNLGCHAPGRSAIITLP